MAERPPPSSAPPPPGGVLAKIAGLPLRFTKITVLVAAVVLVLCTIYAWDLPISTSRYKLVSDDHPQQAQLLQFFDRFGYPDSLVLVVSGGDQAMRRAAVNELDKQLSQLPELHNRTLGRLRPQQVAELLLLFKPEVMAQLRQRSGKSPADLVEGGIPMWLQGVDEQLGAALEGDGPEVSEKETADGLRAMAAALRALDAQLAGTDPFVVMSEMAIIKDMPKGIGVDGAGYLVTETGDVNLVALFPDLPGAEGFEVKPLVEKVRAVRERVAAEGVTVEVTGLPALVTDELEIVKRGLMQTSVGTSAAILLLLLLAFRSKRYTVLALLPLGLGIVLTLAAVRAIYGGLNLITSSFVPVLLALGIDFGVYVLSRYGELVRRGRTTHEAIRGALAKAGPGMLIGALTTVMAFLMTTTTEFTAYSELGVITAIGLLLMVVVTFLLLPALIFLAGRGKQIAAPELKGMEHLPGFICRRRWPVLMGALLLIGVSAIFWPRIRFNARYFDFLPESTESASGLRHIEHDKTLSPVQGGVGCDSVEEARALAEKLRALTSVGSVQTATDLLPKLSEEGLEQLRLGFTDLQRQPNFDKLRNRKRSKANLADKVRDLSDTFDEIASSMRDTGRRTKEIGAAQQAAKALLVRIAALPDDAPSYAATERKMADLFERAWTTANAVAKRGHYLPSDLPPLFKARFVSKDGKALAVYASPSGDIWKEATAKVFAADVRTVAPTMSGMAMDIYDHIRMIKQGFTRASLYAAGLVLLVLLAGFRNLKDALLAMVPVVFGACWMLGAMGLVGLNFDVANVVTLPLILGIGIDAGAHMMHRYRQSAEEHGGVARLDEIIRGTGAAVLLASLTTASGFAALMIGDYGAMKTLGLTMTIGVVSCLIASLLVLPAVLVVTKKAR